MAHCILIGDSIAVGLAGALKASGYLCGLAARVGASAANLPGQIAQVGLSRAAIISVGTNDAAGVDLSANLLAARMALGKMRVVWLLPYRRSTAYTITRVAFRFGDDVVDLAGLPSRDHIHPANYRALAAALPR